MTAPASWAGLRRVEFLLELKRYGSFPLEAQLRELEASAGRDR